MYTDLAPICVKRLNPASVFKGGVRRGKLIALKR